jgi:hypothetical protein
VELTGMRVKKRRNFYEEEEFKVDCSSINICIDI